MIELKCNNCGKKYKVYPSTVKWNKIRQRKHNFCSRKCIFEFRKGKELVKYIQVNCENCGKKFLVPPYEYRYRRKKHKYLFCSRKCYYQWREGKDFMSLEAKEKLSKERKGKNGPNWKGGLTSKNRKLRRRREFKKWRKAVFERDNYTCWICDIKTYKGLGHRIELHPHHLFSFVEYPELRFKISNGLTLCKFCHKTYTNWGQNQGK